MTLNTESTKEKREDRILRFLEREVWSKVSADQLGRSPDRKEREHILGYNEE